jgi:hypothetical protein
MLHQSWQRVLATRSGAAHVAGEQGGQVLHMGQQGKGRGVLHITWLKEPT